MLAEPGVPVRAFGRDWSTHPVDRLRTWEWRRPDLPAADATSSRADAYREMAAAVATLNIHGDQDGLTMRTFEASGVGRPPADRPIGPRRALRARRPSAHLVETTRSWSSCATSGARRDVGRRASGEAGRRRTLAEHTFDHRVAVLAEAWDRRAPEP